MIIIYSKNNVHNILKYKNLNNKNQTKSTKCQYKIIHEKNINFVWDNWQLLILILLSNKKNTPNDTWLKCNKSIPNRILQNELVLAVNVSRENSHNWFHINKNPSSKLKNAKIKLNCRLLQFINIRKQLQNIPEKNKKHVFIIILKRSK